MTSSGFDKAASHTAWRTAQTLLRDVVDFRPRQLAAIAGLTLANGVTEALTFTALVPLLGLIGLAPAAEPGSVLVPLLQKFAAITGRTPGLESVLVAFLAAIALRAGSGYLGARLTADYMAARIDHVRRRLYSEHSRANWLFLSEARRSHDTHALTMLAEGTGYIVLNLVALLSSIVLAVSALAVALLVAPRLTLLLMLVGIAVAIPIALVQVSSYRRGAAKLGAMQRLFDVVDSRMSSIKLAKAFSIEAELEREFAEASAAYSQSMSAMREAAARARLLQDIASALALVVVAYVGVKVLSVGSLELIVLIAICARVFPLVNTAQSTARALVEWLPDYAALLRQEEEARAAAEARPGKLVPLPLEHAVELRNISFTYPGTDTPVLKDISVALPARKSVGVLGLSGSGKTTLVDIIAGLIAPDRGDLVVDGAVITDEKRPHWRRGIAYVPQDAPLLHDSIRANLVLGARDASDDDLWRHLDMVGAKDLVAQLPQGLQTVVGERGTRLSGGQRQRLRLASALLRRPHLLILDEATNALSPADEEEIIAALKTLRESTTMIIVSHRVSTIAWTDSTIVLGPRGIEAFGTTTATLASHAGRATT